MSDLTPGEKAARINFKEDTVDVTEIKIKYAELINEIEQFKSKNSFAVKIAQIELEKSLGWAIKAITS